MFIVSMLMKTALLKVYEDEYRMLLSLHPQRVWQKIIEIIEN